MATDPKQTTPAPDAKPSRPARGGVRRLAIGANVFAQVVLIAIIVLVINILSFRQFARWDFSRNQKYALSSMTENVLKNLDEPVKAIVFFPSAQAIYGDVTSLLKEYEYASGKKMTVEYVDPYRNLNRATELAEKYKFGATDNIVILDYKGKSKFVNAQDMAELDMSGAMYGQPPTVRSFKGEQAITSALIELTEEKQNKFYLVSGHGEPELTGQELSGFKAYAERMNIKLDTVNLNSVDAVPADASGVIIFAPKTDLSEREMKLLSDFWNDQKGRLLVMLSATDKTPRLDEFLKTEGIRPRNDLVLKTGKVLARDPKTGSIGLQTGIMIDPLTVITPASKEIAKDLAGIGMQLLGATRSLDVDPAQAQTLKIKATPILESGEGFWGETEYTVGSNSAVFFDPKKDQMGPLMVGVAMEKGGMDDPRVKVETARMIVFGNGMFLTDSGLRVADVGIDLAMNALNWLTNREAIAGIAPKDKKPVALNLKEDQLARLALTVLLVIPCIVAIIGLATWWQRRA